VNRLPSINLDALKRPTVLISIGSVIVLALLWWFLWMSPQSSKLTSIHSQIATLNTELNSDKAQLLLVKSESKVVKQNYDKLLQFSQAVPTAPDQQILTTQIYDLAKSTGVQLTSFSDNSLIPPASNGLGEIPVAITIVGNHTQCLNFLDDLYSPKFRLLTISTFSPAPSSSASSSSGAPGTVSILAHDTLQYTFILAAIAYYYPGGTSLSATTTATAATTAATTKS